MFSLKNGVYQPNTEENISIWKHSDVYIIDQDGMEMTGLFIAEKGVRHPNLFGIGQGQITEPPWNGENNFRIKMKTTSLCQVQLEQTQNKFNWNGGNDPLLLLCTSQIVKLESFIVPLLPKCYLNGEFLEQKKRPPICGYTIFLS